MQHVLLQRCALVQLLPAQPGSPDLMLVPAVHHAVGAAQPRVPVVFQKPAAGGAAGCHTCRCRPHPCSAPFLHGQPAWFWYCRQQGTQSLVHCSVGRVCAAPTALLLSAWMPAPLPLQDDDMNSLLPFGEYVSPAQRAAEQASLETWELERLLIRLAASQRHHRSSRHGGGSSRHRRQGSRGEGSAPQPIRGSGGATVAPEAVAAAWWSLPPDAAAGPAGASSASSSAAATGSNGRELRPVSAPSGAYPSSWPPAGGPEASSSGGDAAGDEGHVVSPRSRAGAMSFKGRLASLRLK